MNKRTASKSRSVPTQRQERVTNIDSVHDNVFTDEPTPGALDVRASRDQETRDSDEIHEEYPDSWTPKGVLDTTDIPSRPGYTQMWVRTKIGNDDDVANIGRRMNEGWRPRRKDSVPKGVYVPVCQMSEYGEVVGIRGMILMERPQRLHDSQMDHYREQTDNMQRAADESVFAVHERGTGFGRPRVDRSTRTTTGRQARFRDD